MPPSYIIIEHSLSDEDIRTAIRNATGPRPSLFVPEASFEILAKRQIGLLEPLGLQCVEMVYEELHRLTAMCESESAELQRFTGLRTRIVDVIHNMLRERLAPTQSMITDMIKIELAYINTNHPDFIGGSRAVAQLTARRANAASEASEAEKGGKSAGGGGGAARRPPPPPRQASGQSFMSHIFKKDGQQQAGTAAAGGPISAGNPFQPGGARGALPSRPNVAFGGGSSSSASSSRGLPPVPQSVRSSGGPSERESVETEIIKCVRRGGGVRLQCAPSIHPPRKARSRSVFPRPAPLPSPLHARTGLAARVTALHSSFVVSHATPPLRASPIPRAASVRSCACVRCPCAAARCGVPPRRSLMSSYYDIVRKNFMDLVPKAIMHFLVLFAKDRIESELVEQLCVHGPRPCCLAVVVASSALFRRFAARFRGRPTCAEVRAVPSCCARSRSFAPPRTLRPPFPSLFFNAAIAMSFTMIFYGKPTTSPRGARTRSRSSSF